IIFALADFLLLVGLGFAQNGILRYILLPPQGHEQFNQTLSSLIVVCGDYIRLVLLVVLLVQCAALLRQWRLDKAAPPAASK
ncbi:MAG: hypothetical protein RR232_08785, partial [Clostridia bacterium]